MPGNKCKTHAKRKEEERVRGLKGYSPSRNHDVECVVMVIWGICDILNSKLVRIYDN